MKLRVLYQVTWQNSLYAFQTSTILKDTLFTRMFTAKEADIAKMSSCRYFTYLIFPRRSFMGDKK
jgi:hypothetical protein